MIDITDRQMADEENSARAWATKARLNDTDWAGLDDMFRQDVIKLLTLRYQSLMTLSATYRGTGGDAAADDCIRHASAFSASINLLEASCK